MVLSVYLFISLATFPHDLTMIPRFYDFCSHFFQTASLKSTSVINNFTSIQAPIYQRAKDQQFFGAENCLQDIESHNKIVHNIISRWYIWLVKLVFHLQSRLRWAWKNKKNLTAMNYLINTSNKTTRSSSLISKLISQNKHLSYVHSCYQIY